MNKLHDLFLLDDAWVYLNHGSFGACPKTVFKAYQDWQRLLEKQPVEFLYRKYHSFLDEAREKLAGFLGTERDNLVFVHNATTAVNVVLNSLDFEAGDEILVTDWEYGACVRACEAVCEKSGAKTIVQKIDPRSPETIVSSIMNGVTKRTKLILVSAITSENAFCLPIERIAEEAKKRDVLVLVDGAHVPGQQSLNLKDLDVDFYTGNSHKWMMAPKGCAFLYVKPELQNQIKPLVVSWGWGSKCEHTLENQFISYMQYGGTQDPSAWLGISASIDFMKANDWDVVRKDCKVLVDDYRERYENLLDQKNLYAYPEAVPNQMFCVGLPEDTDKDAIREHMISKNIEVFFSELNGQKMIRVSVQGYVTKEDLEVLYEALAEYYA